MTKEINDDNSHGVYLKRINFRLNRHHQIQKEWDIIVRICRNLQIIKSSGIEVVSHFSSGRWTTARVAVPTREGKTEERREDGTKWEGASHASS